MEALAKPLYNYLPTSMTRNQLRNAFLHAQQQLDEMKAALDQRHLELKEWETFHNNFVNMSQNKQNNLISQIKHLTNNNTGLREVLAKRDVAIASVKELYCVLEHMNIKKKQELAANTKEHGRAIKEMKTMEAELVAKACLDDMLNKVDNIQSEKEIQEAVVKIANLQKALEVLQYDFDAAIERGANAVKAKDFLQDKLDSMTEELEAKLNTCNERETRMQKEKQELAMALDLTLYIFAGFIFFSFLIFF